MSSVGDAFSGATSGVSDQTLSDASLGSDITGGGSLADTGSSSLFGGGPTEFGQFSDIANALSGGGASPNAAQSIAMTPPSAAAATGGDPTGAAGGTQSATSPGSAPAGQQSGGGAQQQNQQQQAQHAPPEAVDQLKQLLKQLAGAKPQGPTGQIPLPGVSAGQTGAQSPQMPLPTLAAGQTGPPSNTSAVNAPVQTFPDFPGGGAQPAGARVPPGAATAPDPTVTPPLPGLAKGETGPPSPTEPQTDAQGNPLTVAGTRADQTPLPPPRPSDAQASTTGGKPTPQTDDQGRPITVQPKAQPKTATTADLPTRVPHPDQTKLPTHKPGPSPAPTPYPATTQIQRDIAGVSTGSPTALADLAHAAMALAPLIGMFMGGGRRGHFGGFRGGRFTHGVGPLRGFGGGMRAMGGRGGGFHYGGARPWPYHHPVHGWDMHHMHPGGGWLPMSPQDGASFGLNPQQDPNQQDPNAPDPNRPPKETGAEPGTPDQVGTSGAIPGVSGKQVDDYTRQAASKWGIDPEIASKILGQESSYGQARRPGDNGTSFGPFQLHFAPDGRAMGDDFMRDTGKDPRDPSTWKDQIDYAMKRAAMGGWGPWTNSMKKLGLTQWSGITTDRRFAGQPRSNQQPTWASKPPAWMSAGIPPEVPVTSQPKVAGQ